MSEQQTCGKGLAEFSALPAKLGELMAAMAESLEAHQAALDLTDENSRKELQAYVRLAQEFGGIAAQAKATAEHMAGYRDLPMGRHDPKAMASSAALDAFTKFAKIEQEMLALLQQRLERDQAMLRALRQHAA
jgi:hypothetical protein